MKITRRLVVGTLAIIIAYFIACIGTMSYRCSALLLANAERAHRDILQKNVEMINGEITDILRNVNRLCVDTKLFDVCADDAYTRQTRENALRQLLGLYLGDYEDIENIFFLSADLTCSYYGRYTLEFDSFRHSALYEGAESRVAFSQWLTAFPDGLLWARNGRGADVSESFAYATRLNISIVDSQEQIQILPTVLPRPFLVLQIGDSLFDKYFAQSLLTEHSYYVVSAQDGAVVASDNPDCANFAYYTESSALTEETVFIEGEKCFVFSQALANGVWHCALVTPYSDLTDAVELSMLQMILITLVVTALASLLSFYFVRRSVKPIQYAASQVEQLLIRAGVRKEGGGERSDTVAGAVNAMNEYLDRLIVENGELQRREQEATIMFLDAQINSHFLNNALNKLHIGALRAHQEQLAERIMRLASIIRYSDDSKKHFIYFYQEFERLEQYVQAMREQSCFQVVYEIDPAIYNCIVPKLLLQPFVENSILHGFQDDAADNMIHIRGRILNGDILIDISDNGAGLSEENIRQILNGQTQRIGCANVNKRIKLIYGGEYGIAASVNARGGATISIRIPRIEEEAAGER